jgi:methylthioribose-1-phosphate isomerase
MNVPEAVRWAEDRQAVDLLDQSRLPVEELRLVLRDVDAVVEAIRELRVRGAPAIGIAAAMGLAADMARNVGRLSPAQLRQRFLDALDRLGRARPTGVNLRWALERMRRRGADGPEPSAVDWARALQDEATRILEEDRAMCLRIGRSGLALLPPGDLQVLTHCNAGALATGGIGTALAPLYLAADGGRRIRVYACEARPVLQGSRLTAWELARSGIDVTVLVDAAAASLMATGGVDLVLVGADRIAANGDVANKIGTYGLAILARHHGIPFYVAAPCSTIDPATANGAAIPVEQRGAEEVVRSFGRRTAPEGVAVHAPAFDVTPASLVSAFVTDRGVVRPPYDFTVWPEPGAGVVLETEDGTGPEDGNPNSGPARYRPGRLA